MTILRAGLVQLNASDDPAANLPETDRLIRDAASGGAQLVATPEVTNIVTLSQTRRSEMLRPEGSDETLAHLRSLAAELEIWLLIGSLALDCGDPKGRYVNRSFLIDDAGSIRARYDKIHLFDVDLPGGESYRESQMVRPGGRAVVAETPWCPLGMSICYDLRFPLLYQALARAGAAIMTVPSAFTVPTGRAHWEVLLRARAIETGSFVLAPAQWGRHKMTRGADRATWGHSLAVDPWGAVLVDVGEGTGTAVVELDLAQAAEARARIPSLTHERAFELP